MAKNIYEEELESPKPKKILLFSGGLDSYIAYKLWKPDLLLYCQLNHRYCRQELETISKLNIDHSTLIIDKKVSLYSEERLDAIIPLRNLFLVSIASRYADTIGMGVLSGEVNGDKGEDFRSLSEQLLSVCYSNSYWCEGRKINLVYPINNYTKAELINEYLLNGFSIPELLATRSCYSTSAIPCGQCSACVKRFIAMTINGIQEHYEVDPRISPIIQEFKKRFNTYDDKRKKEIEYVFGW